jgi:hypothetical protein
MAVTSTRHLPVVGGIAAWPVPVVAGTLAAGALGLGLLEIAAAIGVLAFVAHTVLRGMIVELAPRGLTRGFVLNGRFIGRATVMPWSSVVSVHTDWRRPGDDTALATTVRDAHGHVIHFTTAMGLSAYWSCLATVVAAASSAHRSGLTETIVAGDPPSRRSVLSAAATAGVLGLVILAVVGLHYVLAQGRSSLSRALEQNATGVPVSAPHDR